MSTPYLMHCCSDVEFPPSFSTSIISLFSGCVCAGVISCLGTLMFPSTKSRTDVRSACSSGQPWIPGALLRESLSLFILHTADNYLRICRNIAPCCGERPFCLQLLLKPCWRLFSTAAFHGNYPVAFDRQESFHRAVFLLGNQPDGIKQEASLCAAGEINSMEFWVLNKRNSCCTWFLCKVFNCCVSLQPQ